MEHGCVNIKAEGNAPMEEDDLEVESTIEDVGIGAIDNVPKNKIEGDVSGAIDEDDEDDDSHASNDDDEEVDAELDVPILEKAHKSLYEGSKTSLLSVVLLLVNLKVMNGLSNVAMTRMLRYAIFFHYFTCSSLTINIGFM